jgi:hypothetical protein
MLATTINGFKALDAFVLPDMLRHYVIDVWVRVIAIDVRITPNACLLEKIL